jgi:agmatine/peptidylarginine deiminase
MFNVNVKRQQAFKGIKTDFSRLNTLFLAYPEKVRDANEDYSELSEFFNKLIRLIPTNIKIKVLVKNRAIGEKVRKLRRNVEYIINAELSTIWLRDTVGFNVNNKILKPIFKPKYYWGAFDKAEQINQNMKLFHSVLNWDMVDMDLKWDGGNLVTNGKIGFITERILKDNSKQFSEQEISNIIKEKLGIEPIYIPELKDDEISHSDGFLAFLDENTIVIPDYKFKDDKIERKYYMSLSRIISNYNLNAVKIKELPKPDVVDGKYTAKGNYTNFLRLNNHIIMPTFDLPELDNYNINILKQYGKVHTIDCNQIAKYGGLLHCISWTI